MSSTTKPKPRVLIVDDNLDALTIERALFEFAGTEVTTASRATAGVALVSDAMSQAKPYDLIVIDIHMPELNGFRVSEQIRGLGYKGAILAFTAVASMKWKKESKEAGIDAYFSKTTLKKELVQALVAQYCPPSTPA